MVKIKYIFGHIDFSFKVAPLPVASYAIFVFPSILTVSIWSTRSLHLDLPRSILVWSFERGETYSPKSVQNKDIVTLQTLLAE